MTIYSVSVLHSVVTGRGNELTGSHKIELLRPQCIIFYNGDRNLPDVKEYKLSDSFAGEPSPAALEFTCKLININLGRNPELMEKCRELHEYAQFVAKVKAKRKVGQTAGQAISETIDECIAENILKDVLQKNRGEVMFSLLTEFNEEKYIQGEREYARELEREHAIEILIREFISFGISTEEICRKLQQYFPITRQQAAKYIQKLSP